jgi:hypothetical protein
MGVGDPFRAAAGAPSAAGRREARASGRSHRLPLRHELEARTRSHHQTFTFQVADAPGEREIMLAVAVADEGRPLARLAPSATAVEPGQTV